ncbi:MAG: S41 family peptidase, partial [Anaerolineae bacterium]|nr:S41 family peptidase [Anaerolineae bacterium]
EVQTLVDQYYLRAQPDVAQRQYAAIRGVLATLEDRYTFFVDPPVAQSESDALAGTYGGIGVQVNRNEAGAFVLFPFEESPATAAGIMSGDILQAVNGMDIELSTPPDQVDQLLRGEVKAGSGVTLTIVDAAGVSRDLFVEFAVINVPSVVWRVLLEDSDIGFVQIIRFTSRTPDELSTALGELEAAHVSALIVDLRNNSGGLLQESVDVAGQLLGNGQVVVYEKSNQSERALSATNGGGGLKDIPLVVLVNQGTASASELVAGAVQDHERGILIGQRTYGKGTVQQIFRLSDNSSVHITSAEWLTPNHRGLESVGLEPDLPMIPDANGRDVELGEAVRYLNEHYNLG